MNRTLFHQAAYELAVANGFDDVIYICDDEDGKHVFRCVVKEEQKEDYAGGSGLPHFIQVDDEGHAELHCNPKSNFKINRMMIEKETSPIKGIPPEAFEDYNPVDNMTARCIRNDYPELEVGKIYKVCYISVQRSRTEIVLEETMHPYNSVCFEVFIDGKLSEDYIHNPDYMTPLLREIIRENKSRI